MIKGTCKDLWKEEQYYMTQTAKDMNWEKIQSFKRTNN